MEHGSTNSRPQAGDIAEETSANSQDPTEADGTEIRVGPLESGFYVEDDGPGIPPAIRDRAFEAGFSGDGGGNGLGLSIVGRIVDAHGWSVRITDSDSGGARFEVRT